MSQAAHHPEPSHAESHAPRRQIVVAVGEDGGLAALATGRAIPIRESRPLMVVSVVEHPSLLGLDPDPTTLPPGTIDARFAERRQSIRDFFAEIRTPPFGYEEP